MVVRPKISIERSMEGGGMWARNNRIRYVLERVTSLEEHRLQMAKINKGKTNDDERSVRGKIKGRLLAARSGTKVTESSARDLEARNGTSKLRSPVRSHSGRGGS